MSFERSVTKAKLVGACLSFRFDLNSNDGAIAGGNHVQEPIGTTQCFQASIP